MRARQHDEDEEEGRSRGSPPNGETESLLGGRPPSRGAADSFLGVLVDAFCCFPRLAVRCAVGRFALHGFVLLVCLVTAALTFFSVELLSRRTWKGVTFWKWSLWLTIISGAWLGLNVVVGALLAVVRFFQNRHGKALTDDYLRHLQRSTVLLVISASGVWFSPAVLDTLASHQAWLIQQSCYLGVVVYATRIAVHTAEEFAIIALNRNSMGCKVHELVAKQDLVVAICRAAVLRRELAGPVPVRLQGVFGDPLSRVTKPLLEIDTQSFASALHSLMKVDRFVRRLLKYEHDASYDLVNMTTEEASKAATRCVFSRADPGNRGYFTQQDIAQFFKTDDQAAAAFCLFDRFGSGRCLPEDSVATIAELIDQQKQLSTTLRDRNNAAAVLLRLTNAVFWIIMGFVACLMYGLSVDKLLIPASTFFLGLSFIYAVGDSLKRLWESVLLIFVLKPFDVGDRITLTGYPTLVVKAIHLFTTEARSPDGRLFLLPNSVIYGSPIVQYRRSCGYALDIELKLSLDTSLVTIDMLEKKLGDFFLKDDSSPWDADSFTLQISSIHKQSTMVVTVWVELLGITWAMPAEYLQARSNLLRQLHKLTHELGIVYASPLQPVSMTERPSPLRLPAASTAPSSSIGTTTTTTTTTTTADSAMDHQSTCVTRKVKRGASIRRFFDH